MKNCLYFAFILLIAACKKQSYDMPASSVTLYQIVKEDTYNFSSFKSLIDRAGLSDLYNQPGEYTVFAPNNGAFAAAGYTTAVIQSTSADSIQRIVKNHIVQGKVDIRSISGTQELTALSGEKILVQKIGDAIYVDGSDVTNPKTGTATNGVINMINKLLVSKSSIMERILSYTNATADYNITFCAEAIKRATNMEALLSDPKAEYTFLAPMNGAFIEAGFNTIDKIRAFDPDSLARLLQYQLIQGRKLSADLDSTPVNPIAGIPIYFDRRKPGTTTTNYANGIPFSSSSNMLGGRGVLHIVARIFPKPLTTTTLARIKSDTSLTFFDAAVTKAGAEYVKMLSDEKSSYTVFAINNQAWRNAGYAEAAAVSAADAAVLAKILKFHMLVQRRNSINFTDNSTAETLLVTGADTKNYITASRTGGYKVKGNANTTSATVSPADVVTTNGLFNVVNMLLLP